MQRAEPTGRVDGCVAMQQNMLTPDLAACIEACNRAHGVALGMAMNHCLETGGDHVAPKHFRLMADCAAICATAADFMLRSSEFHRDSCALCADVCIACADSCAGLDGMEACVDACRACAASCRAIPAPLTH